MKKIIILPTFFFTSFCYANTSIVLDFGSVSAANFGTSETDLEIQYSNIATGINATLQVVSVFDAQTPSNHGSVTGTHVGAEGDIRINSTASLANTDPSNIDNGGIFTLQLWDANIGDGFSTGYTNPSSYEWDLTFYDIDAGTPNNNGFFTYDYLRLLTAGTYTVSANTLLEIATLPDNSVSFSGEPVGVVPGQDGLGTPFTNRQINSTVQYNLVDTNSVTFEYAALRNGGNNLGTGGRNLLIDGGEISNVFDGVNTTTGTIIPEPTTALLVLIGSGALLNRKRKN